LLAFYKAKKGKEAKMEVINFQNNLDDNLLLLRKRILSENPEFGKYHYFTIYDPKQRTICAAAFEERVMHHAIMNVCHPFFEKFQISDSYASRVGKGSYKALQRATWFSKHYKCCAKFDVRKYFDSIDHQILLSLLNKLFREKRLLCVFEKIIESYHVEPGKGVPIGNLTSQYFANHYLAFLDHFVKDQMGIKGYVRYMDDFLMWHNDKPALKQTASDIGLYLLEKLNLTLKPVSYHCTSQGVSFLGYTVFPEKLYLNSRSKHRFIEKLKRYNRLLEAGVWSEARFKDHATALFSFVKHADSLYFRRKVLSHYGQ